MRFKSVLKILGILLMFFSLSLLPPIGVELFYRDGDLHCFIVAFASTFASGFLLWLLFQRVREELKNRDGFLLVTLFWVVLCGVGAIPLMLAAHPHLAFVDAIFEAVSGLTTTGATILPYLDGLPHSILFYRQELQFLGGMGIIVLAIAIMPMLGVGGMQLYRAETPGPIKDSKLTPRIAETAKTLWFIYVALTGICAMAYWFGGMQPFDAVCESFSTISTGGFTIHDNSFAFYHSPLIEMVAMFFMFLGGTNFALHFVFLQRGSLTSYWRDSEFRFYLLLLGCAAVIVFITLVLSKTMASTHMALVKTLLPYLIMYMAMIGGCAGSTSGGVKVMRVMVLNKQGQREIQRLVHPKAVIPIKIGSHSVSERVIESVWAYIALFALIFVILLLLLLASNLDLETAFAAVAGCLSNSGQTIGSLAIDYSALSSANKLLLTFTMLAGRLEMFTLIVLFTPAFWKR